MNVSLSPQMARFIRGKVKDGEYTNVSEVVRDAIRRMQEMDTARLERAQLAELEASLSPRQKSGIKRSIRKGLQDIEGGRHEDYDAAGLRALARELVDQSAKKTYRRTKSR